MRAQWRHSLVRVALSAAVMLGIAMSGSIAPRRIAFAQAGAVFEVSRVFAGGRAGGAGPAAADNMARRSRTPQRIAFHAALVGDIMAFAYGLPLDRIERRPQWMYDDHYDVAATAAAPASLPEQKLMLQKLLEERFGLVVHRISNPSPVYFLVRGSKVNLTETQEGDSEDIPQFRIKLSDVAAKHVSMSDLAAWLYPQLGLPVLDKTGITGWFDIEIPGLPIRGGAEGTIRAVRDALGLELQVQRGTAESLIIDHVEKPSQN